MTNGNDNMDELEKIAKKYLSNDIDNCIEGLKLSADIIKKTTTMSLKLLENDQLDLLFITEHISNLFNDFFNSLNKMLDSDNRNLRFWASTLLLHYSIKDTKKAEDILLETVKYGEPEQAELATTMLNRSKNIKLSESILIRLNNIKMDDKTITFFKEKLTNTKDK